MGVYRRHYRSDIQTGCNLMTWWLDRLIFGAFWVLDHLLGWLLSWPKDLALITLGAISAAVLILARATMGNHDLLERCKADRKRIKALAKSAKTERDAATIKRLQKTRSLIALRQLKIEFKVLLAAAPCLALLIGWCSQRLQFYPVPAGEPIQVVARFPSFSNGQLAHLVPEPGLQTANGWIQPIQSVPKDGRNLGMTLWTLRSTSEGTRTIRMRYQNNDLAIPLNVGSKWSTPPQTIMTQSGIELELKLRPVMLFNVLPGIRSLGLPGCVLASAIVCLILVATVDRWPGFYRLRGKKPQ
jgi:uncharacterized membrane protein (DUF106 family)